MNLKEPGMFVYLDNHSATKPCQSALERMRPYLEEEWAASFALHSKGVEQLLALDGRIEMIYDLVGASKEDQFAFASSGAAAIQQILWSVFLEVSRKEGKCHFLASCLEDAPLMLGLKRLEELGCFVKTIGCNPTGCLDPKQLFSLINPRTALVSISLAQGLTGVIQPIDEIAALCKEKGVLLHVDATYAIGKMSLDFPADYLTFSGDRMHGLKSSAVSFAKKGRPFCPLIVGVESIDVPSLAALSAAAQQSLMTLDVMGLEIARLRDRLEQGILAQVADAQVLFSNAMRLPNTSVIAFSKVHQEALLYALNQANIYATFGGSHQQMLSKLCLAAGISEHLSYSALSFSLSRYTTEEEIDRAIVGIVRCVEQLQPYTKDLSL